MKQITLNIQEQYLKRLDELVEKGFYPNRAEAIRLAVKDLLELHENEKPQKERDDEAQ